MRQVLGGISIAVLCATLASSVSAQAGLHLRPTWWQFIGQPVTLWADDGRTMVLTQPYGYVDADGRTWEAPAGWLVDGASIPRLAWTIVGGPLEGAYRNASIIHDVACDKKQAPWDEVHKAFYQGMRAMNVGRLQAKLMYAAVYHLGPRWPVIRENRKCVRASGKTYCRTVREFVSAPRSKVSTDAQFALLADEIKRRDQFPDLEDLGREHPNEYITVTGEKAMSLREIDQYLPPQK